MSIARAVDIQGRVQGLVRSCRRCIAHQRDVVPNSMPTRAVASMHVFARRPIRMIFSLA